MAACRSERGTGSGFAVLCAFPTGGSLLEPADCYFLLCLEVGLFLGCRSVGVLQEDKRRLEAYVRQLQQGLRVSSFLSEKICSFGEAAS